ncbi:MAG: GAF domain-containing protein [Chloroflexi bacterium]|nr:GAF domain-containing protein [Chloroflexota bacterium]
MNPIPTRPATVHEQILALGQQTAQIRQLVERGRVERGAVDALTSLETTLIRIGNHVRDFEKEHRNLSALADVGKVVNSSLELDDVLRIVMDNIVRLTHAERGFLMLRENNGEMVTYIARDWDKETINPSELTVSRTVIQRVIDTGEPLLTTNAQDDQRLAGQESIIAFNLRSILCVPLKVKNDLIGVIYADNRVRSGIFSETELSLLTAFANQAAVALDNARLFSSLRNTLEEVIELKSLMDNIFASIASGVITADIENQVTLCNRAAESILGHASTELLGLRLEEIMPTFAPELQTRLNEVHQTDKPVVGFEVHHTLPQRGSVDWRLNLSPLKDAGQKTQGIAIVLDDMTERKKLEAQRRLLERMVSPAVIDQLDLNSVKIGGKRVDITIVFADIRGFTTYSEKQTPEDLVAVLNRYLGSAAEAILNEAGTVDKFLGDAVMAWFNAPLPQPDHTLRAVRASLAIRDAVFALHKELPEAAHLSFGVGIHYGDAILGWIGTEKRLEYTAISDSVNTAKRIQENAAKNQILITRDAYDRVASQVEARPFAPLTVKGKTQPIDVYEVLGLK